MTFRSPEPKKGLDFIGTGVIFFCHDGHGRFLMAKRGVNARDERGRWDIGAGAIEFGENIGDALRREIHEEYCTDVIGYDFLGFRNVRRTHEGHPTHWIALDYLVAIDPKKVRNGEPHKFDDIRWFNFDGLPDVTDIHSQLPTFFERYSERLKPEIAYANSMV
ncbi:MAG: NUDIX domain-containing protein [Patescibacteria group bacterium]|nr:NUDIX domain-containing protein [Patescibacteria group bacterium]